MILAVDAHGFSCYLMEEFVPLVVLFYQVHALICFVVASLIIIEKSILKIS